MEKILVRFDPTSQSTYARCPREFYNTNRRGLVPRIANEYLAFGSAFHLARAELRKTGDFDKALATALKSYGDAVCKKTPPRSMDDLARAVMEWTANYVTRNDRFQPIMNARGELAIELSFSMPFVSTDKVDVVLCGVVDEVTVLNGRYVIMDCKTTSSASRVDYLKSYATSPQMSIYAYAIKDQLGLAEYPRVVIDGVFLSKNMPIICARNQEPFAIDPVVIDRVIARAKEQALEIAERIASGNDAFTYEFTACDGKYNKPCSYKDICCYPAATQEMLINTMFTVRDYNPQTFNTE